MASLLTSAGITPTLSSGDDLYLLRINAAYSRLTHETQRQFLPDQTASVRYYPGSGTGKMVVDEYIDVTQVQFLYAPLATGIDVTRYVEVDRKHVPKTEIEIYQGPTHAVGEIIDRFPEGRSNIEVTAKWGYAANIPQDVWAAILYKAAADIAVADQISVAGRPLRWKEGDVEETFANITVGEAAGWIKEWDNVIMKYQRPISEMHRRRRVPFI